MGDIKYPKPRTERKEQKKKIEPDAKKYEDAVNLPAVTAVSKREKRIEDLTMPGKTETEKQLEKQTILARVLQAVKKW